MHSHDRAKSSAAETRQVPARTSVRVGAAQLQGVLGQQTTAGNAAVVQMLRRAGSPGAERSAHAGAGTGPSVQRAGGEGNAVPFFDPYGDVYVTSDESTEVKTADGHGLMVDQGSLKYLEADSPFDLWHRGSVLTTADVLCTPGGVLVHRTTGQPISKPTAMDTETAQTEISAELLDRIGTPPTVSVAGTHYKSVLRPRREGWGAGATQDFSIGDRRAEDGWRGMYLATSQAHARGYLVQGGVLLEIATPNLRAYDLTGIDYAALGFASPLASARLVKALLGFDQDRDLMESLAERNMVLRSGEPGGEVEVIVPYPLANRQCQVSAELERNE
ncbi:hypothetical protein ACIQM0_32550 [Streptomyces sp. NPDC091387]|uniref:hypothetical protein n=1 Tax=Streptomyces sp. NPDC091387 TaxID=3365998 RepID=UPI003815F480